MPEAAAQEQKDAPSAFQMKAILGQKVGMTQIFSESGQKIPVTVIYTGGCTATATRTKDKHGYDAVQLGMGELKVKNLSRPLKVQFEKEAQEPKRWLKEFRVADAGRFTPGQKVTPDVFVVGDYVDVSGVSKGKGFAGVMKRHGFSGLPASHGASDKERSPGSSGGGSGQPQRVLKGTRMAGRMGSDWVTVQKLEIVKIDKENDLILVRGAVPGTSEGMVVVRETSRALKHKPAPIAQQKSAKKAANVKKAEKPAAKK